jgi:hypothetical protein
LRLEKFGCGGKASRAVQRTAAQLILDVVGHMKNQAMLTAAAMHARWSLRGSFGDLVARLSADARKIAAS